MKVIRLKPSLWQRIKKFFKTEGDLANKYLAKTLKSVEKAKDESD
jgi:hypothetical protein